MKVILDEESGDWVFDFENAVVDISAMGKDANNPLALFGDGVEVKNVIWNINNKLQFPKDETNKDLIDITTQEVEEVDSEDIGGSWETHFGEDGEDLGLRKV